MCFIGDGNNMMNSLVVGGLKVGMKVSVACPEGYRPPKEIIDFAAAYGDMFEMTDSPAVAIKDADVVLTDVWTSMGQEEERAEREKAFAGYCISKELMENAKDDAIVVNGKEIWHGRNLCANRRVLIVRIEEQKSTISRQDVPDRQIRS